MDDSQKPSKDFLLPASILVAGLLVAGAVIYSTGSGSLKEPANIISQTGEVDLADDDVILGSADAPVTIVEFGDYQCPFCGKFFTQIEPKLRDEYIKTGKVKMVYRDFAFLGPESQGSALASQCAAEQGKFWSYHDGLYEAEVADGKEHNGNLSAAFLKSLAVDLGLDKNKFNSCLDSQKYKEEVVKDYNDGVEAGVRGTPTAFINGKAVSGALPYESYKTLIEEALAGSR